ncbi:protein of unknown function (DUF3352) [Rubidibacter lacunae KORDI 51-2]|uniref:DUF3352 domain-containing protein n=1 Tax=Rubidibacter lacunae KORDI 51-2 TaxID=582515 RepID=U5D519_9CHRO|nr:DUF3352 domain-containing protein [Rubidibacter lacunae]ERN39778.1 protein of unknown function (DUF3352) [Rubidibacter lacunae KORDI 51-2]
MSRITRLAVTALGVVAIAAGGVYAYFRFVGGRELTLAAGAELVPADATVVTHVQTSEQAWSQFARFGTPEVHQLFAENVQQWGQENLSDTELDYQTDIAPWLGNVMFAALPAADAIPTGENFVAIVGIRNKLKALDFVEGFKDSNDIVSTEKRDYQGIEITSFETAEGDTANAAFIEQFIVFSPDGTVLERVIDTFRGEPSLATTAEKNAFLGDDLGLQQPLAQLYLADLTALLRDASGNLPSDLSPEVLESLEAIESIAVGVGLEDLGLRVRALAAVDPEWVAQVQTNTSDNKLLERLPANTLAVLNGEGLVQGWQNANVQAESDPQAQQALDAARQLVRNNLGLDLDREVFGWMDGEFAFAIVAPDAPFEPQLGLGGVLMLETSDRATSEKALAQVDTLVGLPFIRQRQTTVGSTEVTEWLVPTEQQPVATRGWLQDDLMVWAIAMPFAEITGVTEPDSLAGSKAFQEVAGALPTPNFGYAFINVTAVRDRLNALPQTPLQQLPPEALAITESVRALGLTASQPQPDRSQLDILVTLEANVQ